MVFNADRKSQSLWYTHNNKLTPKGTLSSEYSSRYIMMRCYYHKETLSSVNYTQRMELWFGNLEQHSNYLETVFPYLFCLWLGPSNILFYLGLLIKDLHKCISIGTNYVAFYYLPLYFEKEYFNMKILLFIHKIKIKTCQFISPMVLNFKIWKQIF